MALAAPSSHRLLPFPPTGRARTLRGDFCCLAAKLVIEVDGGQHGRDADTAYDAKRTSALEAQGYRVLRFSNAAVMRDIGSVLDTIFAALSEAEAAGGTTPTSHSSPQGGGEPPET